MLHPAFPHGLKVFSYVLNYRWLAEDGLEPSIFRVWTDCTHQLCYSAIFRTLYGFDINGIIQIVCCKRPSTGGGIWTHIKLYLKQLRLPLRHTCISFGVPTHIKDIRCGTPAYPHRDSNPENLPPEDSAYASSTMRAYPGRESNPQKLCILSAAHMPILLPGHNVRK